MEIKAAQTLQRIWRGKTGRDKFKLVKSRAFKAEQKKKYLEERKEQELRLAWEKKLKEQVHLYPCIKLHCEYIVNMLLSTYISL